MHLKKLTSKFIRWKVIYFSFSFLAQGAKNNNVKIYQMKSHLTFICSFQFWPKAPKNNVKIYQMKDRLFIIFCNWPEAIRWTVMGSRSMLQYISTTLKWTVVVLHRISTIAPGRVSRHMIVFSFVSVTEGNSTCSNLFSSKFVFFEGRLSQCVCKMYH